MLLGFPAGTALGACVRVLGIFSFLLMHLGIAVTMRLNAIGLINAAALVAFLPAAFWRSLPIASLTAAAAPLGAAIVRAADVADQIFFTAAARSVAPSVSPPVPGPASSRRSASPPVRQPPTSDAPAVAGVVGVPSAASVDAPPHAALVEATREMLAFTAAAFLTSLRLAVLLYTLIFTVGGEIAPGIAERCGYPNAVKRAQQSILSSAPNAAAAAGSRAVGAFRLFGELLRLDQRYNIFAPRPPTEAFWLVFPGRLRNGHEVDAFAVTRAAPLTPPFAPLPRHLYRRRDAAQTALGDATTATTAAAASAAAADAAPALAAAAAAAASPYDYDPREEPPPDFAVRGIHDDRWNKYLEIVIQGWGDFVEGTTAWSERKQRQERIRLRLGQYVCRMWNRAHGGGEYELLDFDMHVYLKEQSTHECAHRAEAGTARGSVREVRVWEHRCFD